jgi:hypothetical protein
MTDTEYLIHSLDNESNSSIMKLTTPIIQERKNHILQQLHQPAEVLRLFHKKLKQYRYVDELPDIQYGCYLRWIPIKDPTKIYLTNGGHLTDIKMEEDGIHLLMKNNMNIFFQIKLDECLVFQKITPQEKTILTALDYLAK